jgi:hypothetical protein
MEKWCIIEIKSSANSDSFDLSVSELSIIIILKLFILDNSSKI